MKTALVLGGTGFIGHHLARRLKSEGYYVRVVDIEHHRYGDADYFDECVVGDLRDRRFCERVMTLECEVNDAPFIKILPYSFNVTAYTVKRSFDEVYQLAALMGGAGFIFTGDHDADVMTSSALININVCLASNGCKIFYSSSACMYPADIQNEGRIEGQYEDKTLIGAERGLMEDDAYPASPDSEYGWEKLFSERLYLAYQRNYNLNVRIARFHNIYGPEGTYKGGREKAPAAICRKVIEADDTIEIWGDGKQTRSFLYIDDCIDAVRLLMQSDFKEPINIGSEEMVSINELANLAMFIGGKSLLIKHIEGPTGVRGRNSNNDLIRKVLGWEPKHSLLEGLGYTYRWIENEIKK